MITSPKAKAIIAAIITSLLGVLGIITQAVNAGTWNSGTTIAVITAALTALGTTFGVYQQANASP